MDTALLIKPPEYFQRWEPRWRDLWRDRRLPSDAVRDGRCIQLLSPSHVCGVPVTGGSRYCHFHASEFASKKALRGAA